MMTSLVSIGTYQSNAKKKKKEIRRKKKKN